jgi:hypothetical protein
MQCEEVNYLQRLGVNRRDEGMTQQCDMIKPIHIVETQKNDGKGTPLSYPKSPITAFDVLGIG